MEHRLGLANFDMAVKDGSPRRLIELIYLPDDTELTTAEIAAKGNFNERGGELGDDDWPVA